MTTIMPHTQGDPPSEEGGYSEWTKAELEAELENRDLPKSGNKDELVARLEEDDAS